MVRIKLIPGESIFRKAQYFCEKLCKEIFGVVTDGEEKSLNHDIHVVSNYFVSLESKQQHPSIGWRHDF
jgi:hypothetical protein